MHLKAYSLISYRGHSENFQNLSFLHLRIALLLEAQFPKGIRLKSFQYEIIQVTLQQIDTSWLR